ncbi:hypothetical protein GF312_07755 [Candidatus Poribacteria bacterium]|nr:hypothetical protein [Candidatus Poribacteria bacterium]
MNKRSLTKHITKSRTIPLQVILFIGGIMLPTIILGYLAVRTSETERLVLWEELKESYTSLANAVVDQVDNMLSSAERDIMNLLEDVEVYSADEIYALSSSVKASHPVISQLFLLNNAGQLIYPLNPELTQRPSENGYNPDDNNEKNIYNSHISAGENQEFENKNYEKAIAEYQHILDKIEDPVYRAFALNNIARCYDKLDLKSEAIETYKKIVDEYGDVTQKWFEIPASAYTRMAELYEDIGDSQSALYMLYQLYLRLSDNIWDMDAKELSFYAHKARSKLKTHAESGDDSISANFAEIDAKVIRRFELLRFFRDYRILAESDIKNFALSSEYKPGFIRQMFSDENRLICLFSYSKLQQHTKASVPAVIGFEADLFYMLSRGLRDILEGIKIRENVVLAVLDAEGNIIGTKRPSPVRTADFFTSEPSGRLITSVPVDSLPFWQVGVYLTEPRYLDKISRRKANLRIMAVIGLILAVAFGIYLILREARKEAELARLRSDFVANVSHELRTPLSSIQIFSETLKAGKTKSKDKQEQYLDTISSESERLARLVDNVLDFSRLERQVKEFDFQPTDIAELIQEVVEAYSFHAEQRKKRISLNVAENIPRIEVDRQAFSQMVMNLIDNAIKYSEENDEITVNVFKRGESLIMQVIDRGVGMDKDELKKIFQKFYRGKSAAELGTGGTGLGLTLAKAVAFAHGGDIVVRSKRGEGSRFSVILPL